MTKASTYEYLETLKRRYRRAARKEKGRILNEATRVTGYHRKAVIRLLGQGAGNGRAPRKRGRQARYGPQAALALKELWEVADHICPQRLHPFLPELIEVRRRHGQGVPLALQALLEAMSPATMYRLLKPFRQKGLRRNFSTTAAGAMLKGSIPLRTFSDWNEQRPGFLEIDLVAHCGDTTEGFYLNTLTAVDILTGWTECEAVWGKTQHEVQSAIHRIARRVPFPVLGLDSDNGSEFINQQLYTYCQKNKITFTRSRPYKKNDSAHVEQKNGQVVRRLVGYDRYSSRPALEALARLHGVVRLYGNYLQPAMKLLSKSRNGAKVHKVYDKARTPYRRLLSSGMFSKEAAAALSSVYGGLDPGTLLTYMHEHQHRLWALADRSAPLNRTPPASTSTVTAFVMQ